jgi:hypothetical protein
MKTKILTLIILSGFLSASCSKFLDVKPAGKLIVPKGDIVSYDNLMNGTGVLGSGFKNLGNYIMLTDEIEVSDNQITYNTNDSYISSFNAYIFRTPYSNPINSDNIWGAFYGVAQTYNCCIDGVNDVRTPETAEEADATIAQATIGRAWSYFTASLIYGPVYKPNGDNSTKVLPYRKTSQVLSPMEDLSTLDEVYANVSKDIHSVLKNVPDVVTGVSRFGKVQTYALLAYYHLFTAKYDSVAYYANKALTMAAEQKGGMDNLFYDMNKFSWADSKVSTEPDARYNSSINTSQGSMALSDANMREMCLYKYVGLAGLCYPSQELLGLFNATTDLRREYFFFEYNGYKGTLGGVAYDDGRRIQNYQTKVANTSGFTYPEILLMRAEGYVRTGKTTEALSDLNYLRKFRHKTGTPNLIISGADNIMLEIANERRREIPVRSHKRFADLKRYTNDINKPWSKSEITHSVRSKSFKQKVDSDYFIMPIPNDVRKYNPQWGLEENTTPWNRDFNF